VGRNVVVRPARPEPIREQPVALVCKCGETSERHPTRECRIFRGNKIRAITTQELVFEVRKKIWEVDE
jgi:hypothetical protein